MLKIIFTIPPRSWGEDCPSAEGEGHAKKTLEKDRECAEFEEFCKQASQPWNRGIF